MQQNHTGRIHQAYIVGYPDGTFKPEKSVSRAEMAALLGRISEEKSSEEQKASHSLTSQPTIGLILLFRMRAKKA